MDSTQARLPGTRGLRLTPRELQAALRKSARRAQKLADAFGKTVPSAEPVAQKSPAKRARATKKTS